MHDPIIHPHAGLVTVTKRKRSIWIKNSQRTVDRYTQRKLAEMAAWEDPDEGTTESLLIPSIAVVSLVLIVAGIAFWFWCKP